MDEADEALARRILHHPPLEAYARWKVAGDAKDAHVLDEWEAGAKRLLALMCEGCDPTKTALLDVLTDLVDDEPCCFDHHGYCQTHGWLDEGECAVARGRRLLGLVPASQP